MTSTPSRTRTTGSLLAAGITVTVANSHIDGSIDDVSEIRSSTVLGTSLSVGTTCVGTATVTQFFTDTCP